MKEDKKRAGWIYSLLIFLLFAGGLLALFYPAIGNFWNEKRQEKLVNTYEENLGELEEEDYSALLKAAQDYNQKISGQGVPDAFAAGEAIQPDPLYQGLLNISGNGVMGYLEIPAIAVRVPILHGTGEDALTQGAGHLIGSSLPVGGSGTHCVLAGHRGLPSSKLFTDLDLVKEGDLLYLHVLDQTLGYEVDQIRIVEPKETESLKIQPEEDLVTLVTCTPYGVNTQRLLVRGHRIELTEETLEEAVPVRLSTKTNYLLIAFIGLAVVAGIVVIYRKVS